MKRSNKGAIPVLTVTLMLTCSGCSGVQYQAVETEIPLTLTAPCDMPELAGDTYGDIVRLAYRQRIALAECSARMQVIYSLTQENKDGKGKR